jgi:uncharacterized protein YndB with AHSA1/START domain
MSSTISTEGFTVTRVIKAPRELVWDAWTLPEHFSRWFGTEEVNVPLDSVVMDVRPGGKLAATMDFGDGNTMEWTGEYRLVDRPSRLEYVLSDGAPIEGIENVVTTFEEVEGGTEVTIFQPRYGFTDEQMEGTVEGYNSFFDALETVVASMA